jgi:predicted GNAT family acetyltransferase
VSDAPGPVRHEPEQQRFTIALGESLAILEYRRVGATTLDYRHTFVPDAFRGRGIASEMAGAALRYARDAGLKVIPSCPFVAAYVARHPEFAPLVAR